MAAKLKKGDRVVVLAGRDKGNEGEILKVLPSDGKALVQGVNMVVRHQRQTAQSQGGRISKEATIDLSNLALIDPKTGGPTRVGFKTVDGKKVRFAKKSGEIVDA
ncbi:MAG: 50S ribosomal protein L24 [Pseudomonadota bacterium]|nr:50S ribosomal protein L24 [Pseudomonadota bacterium]